MTLKFFWQRSRAAICSDNRKENEMNDEHQLERILQEQAVEYCL
jgi:hypothetical protein